MARQSAAVTTEPHETTGKLNDLGVQLQRARRNHGLTLDALAQRSGFSKSYLSRIENGKKIPPLATLARVADALGAQLSELLRAVDQDATNAAPFVEVVRAGQREGVVRGASAFGYDYLSLANTMPERHMQPLLFSFPSEIGKHVFFEHKGEEFLFILSGTVEWQVGHEKHILNAGDSVYFDARIPHRGRALNGKAQAIVVLYVPQSMSVAPSVAAATQSAPSE